MPKIKNEHTHANPGPSQMRDGVFVVVTDGFRRVVLNRAKLRASYDDALDIIYGQFDHIPRSKIVVQTDRLHACDGEYVDIPEESWRDVLSQVSLLRVVERNGCFSSPAALPMPSSSQTSQASSQASPGSPTRATNISVTIESSSTRKRVELDVKSTNTRMSSLLAAYNRALGEGATTLLQGARNLSLDATLKSLNISSGAILTAGPRPPTFTLFVEHAGDQYGFIVSPTTRITSVTNVFKSRFYERDPAQLRFYTANMVRLRNDGTDRVGEYGFQGGDYILAKDD
ncbi:hypothetical protein CYLTODRAFT_441971 [Cylindrobasidium torrendii FP15055 ss-10]|uniref:Uncharacterized protein n=1 Tax=Cylindrobasidium torrendii FP15055 ss-10 TaxID=1314674 RepID=A0A0D7BJ78_9AGAR|nr:hypothetical protein CYLTODRAFT_441971 [Cylindrobasidium torrendii FP15055 ss-10]